MQWKACEKVPFGEVAWAAKPGERCVRARGLRGICCEGFGNSRVRPLTARLVRRFESEGFAACAAAARGG